MIAFSSQIVKYLGGLNKIVNPDSKHNTGNLLGQIFLWQTIKKMSDGKLKELWEMAEAEKMIEDPKKLTPGDHDLVKSPHFLAAARVSQPVRRFDPDELANNLHKRYRVPLATAKEMIEDAKLPTTSTVTKTVKEIAS